MAAIIATAATVTANCDVGNAVTIATAAATVVTRNEIYKLYLLTMKAEVSLMQESFVLGLMYFSNIHKNFLPIEKNKN